VKPLSKRTWGGEGVSRACVCVRGGEDVSGLEKYIRRKTVVVQIR